MSNISFSPTTKDILCHDFHNNPTYASSCQNAHTTAESSFYAFFSIALYSATASVISLRDRNYTHSLRWAATSGLALAGMVLSSVVGERQLQTMQCPYTVTPPDHWYL